MKTSCNTPENGHIKRNQNQAKKRKEKGMRTDRIVLASRNKGKLAELAELLRDREIGLVDLDAFPEIGEIEETGSTFAENALLKARAVAKATGLIAVADDSGLAVDALDGAPGVFSARYGDDWEALPGESRDQRNTRKLLHFMRKIPREERGCHFETAIAAAAPGGLELVAKGRWQGRLLLAPLGENGFGYDPVFWDPELEKSAAQLGREEKNAVSHRGRALAALLEKWPEFAAKAAAE